MDVELRKWTMEGKEDIRRLCSQVDRSFLSDRLPEPYTDADAEWWIRMVEEKDGTEGLWRAIFLDGSCVGNISIEKKGDVYRRDGEIGYMMEKNQENKGIMTEAVKKLCRLAFESQTFDLARITGCVYAPNTASRRVLEKSGFQMEGILRNGVWKNGKLYDLCIYGILKEHVL